MTEQPPRGSLPNTKAVRLQAHSLAAPGSRSSSGVPVAARDGPTPSRPVCLTGQSRRLLHLLQTEPGASLTCLPSPFSQVSRSPASTPARGCDCGFFFFFFCCLNKSLFLWLQLEGDTRRNFLSIFIWLQTMLNSPPKQTILQ